MFGFDHPFFRPLWRRIVTVAVTIGWAVFELTTGSPFWAILFGALGVATLWGLLIAYKHDEPDKEDHE
ncbi:MAG: hypothetical protein CVT71_01010 [Alphaproteobacteria bacterium HGW-Alphaproteobacteria-10]|jgi:hypothetical protein|nr:MAG: hypothetical protein CVT71_01010 [Alphaproteobacteria bacterium HGW-Alphaproteobacteria-10]